MYLKTIEIQGFKSFAEKIMLQFSPGITSIVGPNGSGKSNIADAVRWVLGEQSAKTLRGSRMEDVIFAGTEHRKQVGFAEVSIIIDNSCNSLPIPFYEVTITRRIFRSGESEYYINKTSCRLKDITELFLDTGLGKEGYSIIGQGRIDEILSTRSEDRRHIFEEASGIMKYKIRKLEAERKIELTKQNLLRINDIINELETQLEPLKQQSDTAKKYLGLRGKLKELEVNVYIENISKIREKVKELSEQYHSVKENIEKENKNLDSITSENRQKSERQKQLEDKLSNVKQDYHNLESNIERCYSEIKLNEERINNLTYNNNRIDSEIIEINQKISGLTIEADTKAEKLKYLRNKHEEYSAKLISYEKQMESVLSVLDETERYMEKQKSLLIDRLDNLSDKKIQINNVKVHIEGLLKRQKNIDNEMHQISFEIDRESMKREDLNENIRKVKELLRKSSEMLEISNKKGTELENGLAAQKSRENNIKSEMQYKTSRRNMLQEMEQNMEGYNRSIKLLLQACKQSDEAGMGIRGALAQLITVDKKFETAIEMALGNAVQNIVTETEEDAKHAIEFLKNNKLGRATFLPISSVKGRYFDKNISAEIGETKGFCGIASDLISCDTAYREIVQNLLGRVIIVENLDEGIKMAKKFGYSFKIVTLDGDIISVSGSMTGGSNENKGVGILGRTREITDLKEEIMQIREEEKVLMESIKDIISNISDVRKNIALEEGIIKNNELVKIRDESQLAQVEENMKKLSAKSEMLKQEKNQLSSQENEVKCEIVKYETELKEIESEIEKIRKIIDEHQEKHKEDQSTRDLLHKDITDYKISVNSILESIQGVQESIDRISGERDVSLKGISKRTSEKNKNDVEIDSIREKNKGMDYLVKRHNEEKSGKMFEIDRIVEERKVIEEELHDIVNRITDINRNIILLQEELSRIEIKKTKIESEMDMIQNRLWDEYELTYTNALELKKDIGSFSQAQKKIAELKEEIKNLGPVNVASIDEYVKTKERCEFMAVQRNDLTQAEEKLHRVIYEMTSLMKRQFMEQFNLININFNIVFKELFDGGRAELKLIDMENVLESGIEIEIQPPGKKLQNMMLLSGGERAFTAIALLFAILLLNPVPFCILDEIEASLDDANVYRFVNYLRKFIDKTQFIMVTHRKGTIEASDTLYGVTMQEHGVSNIVSMKLDEKVG